jgi:hypothetical protein
MTMHTAAIVGLILGTYTAGALMAMPDEDDVRTWCAWFLVPALAFAWWAALAS